jgi:hypothetical protein
MAERAAFRGRYGRAIARYRDALFYLSRAEMGDAARDETAERINREIELLRARVATDDRTTTVGAGYDIIVEGMEPGTDGDGEQDDAPGREGQT